MKTVKYYQVSQTQIVLITVFSAIISAALTIININVKEYIQQPTVNLTTDNKCVNVVNIKNGDNYSCSDVNVTLKNFKVNKI